MMKRIAIIGGGIAGLSAAYRAEQLRRSGALDYVLFEQSPRLGGVIRTEIVDGCVVEAGPDSFLTEKPAAAALCREIGLGDQLIASNDAHRKTQIVINGRLVPLPDGLQFMVPTQIVPMALTPLFSLGTKLRFLREWLFKAPLPASDDESVAAFVRRHFGEEVVGRLADPLLSGIYGGDSSRLSARAVLPRMVETEAKYGSLTRAALASRKQSSSTTGSPAPALFTSLRGGMQQMVEALAAQLDPRRVRLNAAVNSLELHDAGWLVRFPSDDGEHGESFDGVVLAVPAYAAAALLQAAAAELARELGEIAYSSSITIALGYEADSVRNATVQGFGFLVPRSERKQMLACTFVHHKFPYRTTEGRALLRCFIGGANAESALQLDDATIVRTVRTELREIIGLSAEPLFARIYRWQRAMAQYEVGHLARINKVEGLRRQLPGLSLAGNAYRGIGVPDCVASGEDAVAELGGTAKVGIAERQSSVVRV
jgi:oxygen-dependent protoporphyrinogen oxidase